MTFPPWPLFFQNNASAPSFADYCPTFSEVQISQLLLYTIQSLSYCYLQQNLRKQNLTIFGTFYPNFEIGLIQYGTLTTSSGHSQSSSIFHNHSQSCSSNILPRNPPICQKIPFLMLSARLWLGCCGPNLHWAWPNLGPGTFSSFLPVQNDLLWFSREIYIPTPVTTCFEFCQNSQKITTSSGHSLYSSISTYNLLLHPSS